MGYSAGRNHRPTGGENFFSRKKWGGDFFWKNFRVAKRFFSKKGGEDVFRLQKGALSLQRCFLDFGRKPCQFPNFLALEGLVSYQPVSYKNTIALDTKLCKVDTDHFLDVVKPDSTADEIRGFY